MSPREILIVEDEESIREALRELLELEGYHAVSAANGREALDLLKKIQKPCLILLDLMMPVMNGWEFTEHIREDVALATIPVVLVTAYGERAKGVPAQRIIKKPVDLENLLKVVREYCGPLNRPQNRPGIEVPSKSARMSSSSGCSSTGSRITRFISFHPKGR